MTQLCGTFRGIVNGGVALDSIKVTDWTDRIMGGLSHHFCNFSKPTFMPTSHCDWSAEKGTRFWTPLVWTTKRNTTNAFQVRLPENVRHSPHTQKIKRLPALFDGYKHRLDGQHVSRTSSAGACHDLQDRLSCLSIKPKKQTQTDILYNE